MDSMPFIARFRIDLLQLNAVAAHGRNAGVKFGAQENPVAFRLMVDQRNRFFDYRRSCPPVQSLKLSS